MKPTHLSLGLAFAAAMVLAGCSDDEAADKTASAGSNGVCLPASDIDHTDILTDSAIVLPRLTSMWTWFGITKNACNWYR